MRQYFILGDIICSSEEALLAAVDNGADARHVLHYVHAWLKSNFKRGREEYCDGTNPVFRFGKKPSFNKAIKEQLGKINKSLHLICATHDLQWGEVLALFRAYMEIHAYSNIRPSFFYGHKQHLKIKKKKTNGGAR